MLFCITQGFHFISADVMRLSWVLLLSFPLLPVKADEVFLVVFWLHTACPVCVCPGLIRTVCVSLLTEILLKSQNTCLLCATTTVTWQKLSAVIDFDILVKTDSADLLLTFLHQCGTFKEILTLSYMYITTCLSQWMSTFFNPCWMSRLNLF